MAKAHFAGVLKQEKTDHHCTDRLNLHVIYFFMSYTELMFQLPTQIRKKKKCANQIKIQGIFAWDIHPSCPIGTMCFFLVVFGTCEKGNWKKKISETSPDIYYLDKLDKLLFKHVIIFLSIILDIK